MMEPASGVDKLSLADTTRLDLTDDTDLLKDISDTSERQVFIHDPTLQPNEFNRATNHPNSLSLLPASSDFARLVPANHQAKIAFHEIATLVKLDNCWNPHCRKFIHVSEAQTELVSFPDVRKRVVLQAVKLKYEKSIPATFA